MEWTGVEWTPVRHHLAAFWVESTGLHWSPVESIWTLGGTAKYWILPNAMVAQENQVSTMTPVPLRDSAQSVPVPVVSQPAPIPAPCQSVPPRQSVPGPAPIRDWRGQPWGFPGQPAPLPHKTRTPGQGYGFLWVGVRVFMGFC